MYRMDAALEALCECSASCRTASAVQLPPSKFMSCTQAPVCLQGSKLDKHQLVLQLSKHKASSNPSQKASKEEAAKQSTKLIVRNIAFEATRKDVMSLFSPFGHIKTCRLPRKFDGTPRWGWTVLLVSKLCSRLLASPRSMLLCSASCSCNVMALGTACSKRISLLR